MNLKKLCMNCMKEKPFGDANCPCCGTDNSGYIPESQGLPPGITLKGRYILGKVLGSGESEITYIAYDHHRQTPSAIKELFLKNRSVRKADYFVYTPPAYRPIFEESKKQFLQEAETLARLRKNDSIVTIKEVFEENNTIYMVMEYPEGENLVQKVKKAPLSCREVIKLLRPIAVLLQTLHQRGVFHLKISPDNIVILPNHKAILLNYGLYHPTLTEGEILGEKTENSSQEKCYTPIEQWEKNGKPGPWSDEYALAATIYFCLTGKEPPDTDTRSQKTNTVKGIRGPEPVETRNEKIRAPEPVEAQNQRNRGPEPVETRNEKIRDQKPVEVQNQRIRAPEPVETRNEKIRELEPIGDQEKTPRATDWKNSSGPSHPRATALQNPSGLSHPRATDRKNPSGPSRPRPIPGNVRMVLKKALALDYKDRYLDIGAFWYAFCREERKNERAKILAVFAGILFIAAAGAGAMIGKVIIPEVIIPSFTYESAEAYLNQEEYTEAYRLFTSLDTYKDARQRAEDIYTSHIGYFLKKYDTLNFGNYPQTKNREKEPITWLVLETDEENQRVLLISEKALTCHSYNYIPHTDHSEDMTWGQSDLESWLNSTFLENAFSPDEQSILCTTKQNAMYNSVYQTSSGTETEDVIFLLSQEEAGTLFESYEKRRCRTTAYAVKQGGEVDESGNCSWWLRTQGQYPWKVTVVTPEGEIDAAGKSVGEENICVRPSVWIDMNAINGQMLSEKQ